MTDSTLAKELTALLNRYSRDTVSLTPDFILADYLLMCLNSYALALDRREAWSAGGGRLTAPNSPSETSAR